MSFCVLKGFDFSLLLFLVFINDIANLNINFTINTINIMSPGKKQILPFAFFLATQSSYKAI